MNQEIDKKQISYSPGKSSRQKYHSALQFACYLSLRLLAATLVVGCGGSHTAGTGGGSTTGSTSGSGGNGGSQGLAAPSNFEATSDVVRTVHLSWVDNSVAESGYKVVRNGYIVATLPENANSYQDSPVLPDTSYEYSVIAFRADGGSTDATTTVLTAHSQPFFWATCKVKAFGDPSGIPGTYWARSSSSNTLSSFMRIDKLSGDVNFGDSFYFGCRQRWDVHTFSGKKYSAGSVLDPETITYDSTTSSNLRAYWVDGSLKKTYKGQRLVAHLKYVNGRYLMTVKFTPETPDSEIPGETLLCEDAEIPDSNVEITYSN